MASHTRAEPVRPLGYIETQHTLYTKPTGVSVLALLKETEEKILKENPGYEHQMTRMEEVKDGAGVPRWNYYFGFAPRVPLTKPVTPPLNPRNLNEADNVNIGNPVVDHSIGMKEQKF